MKRKLSYLENKVKEKQSRGCGKNDQEQYEQHWDEQSSTNKEIVKGKKYTSTSMSKHDSKAEKAVEDQVVKADFLLWQKSLAYSLRIFLDNFSLLLPLQRVLAAWFKIFN